MSQKASSWELVLGVHGKSWPEGWEAAQLFASLCILLKVFKRHLIFTFGHQVPGGQEFVHLTLRAEVNTSGPGHFFEYPGQAGFYQVTALQTEDSLLRV